MKTCNACFIEKPLSLFRACPRYAGGFRTYCRVCENKQSRERHAKDPSVGRNNRLKQAFNINLNQYNNLFELQNGLCAICKNPETVITKHGKTKALAVDHCHRTGKIRGLLCQKHNQALGLIDDKPELAINLAKYLNIGQTLKENTNGRPKFTSDPGTDQTRVLYIVL